MFLGSVARCLASDRCCCICTFPVVVSVDVEGVQQLIVIMSQQVQTSGSRLDDTDDLMTTQQLTLIILSHIYIQLYPGSDQLH